MPLHTRMALGANAPPPPSFSFLVWSTSMLTVILVPPTQMFPGIPASHIRSRGSFCQPQHFPGCVTGKEDA